MKNVKNVKNVQIEADRDSRVYQTRLALSAEAVEIEKNLFNQVEDNLKILLIRMEKDLRQNVFPDDAVQLIEKIRFLTDLKTIANELASKGSVVVAATRGIDFLNNVRSITSSLDEIPDEEIKSNYKLFLKKLEQYLIGKT